MGCMLNYVARIRYVAITRVWVACSILRFSQIYYGHSFQWRKLIFFQFAEVCLQYKTNNQLFQCVNIYSPTYFHSRYMSDILFVSKKSFHHRKKNGNNSSTNRYQNVALSLIMNRICMDLP